MFLLRAAELPDNCPNAECLLNGVLRVSLLSDFLSGKVQLGDDITALLQRIYSRPRLAHRHASGVDKTPGQKKDLPHFNLGASETDPRQADYCRGVR